METLVILALVAQLQAQLEQLKIEQLNNDKKEITLAELPTELAFIAVCESGARQHYKNGQLVIGPYKEVGIMQIHPVHFKRAKELGYDLKDGRGNMAFALNVLYKENGLKDWSASEKCWKPKLARLP